MFRWLMRLLGLYGDVRAAGRGPKAYAKRRARRTDGYGACEGRRGFAAVPRDWRDKDHPLPAPYPDAQRRPRNERVGTPAGKAIVY